jgi:NTE family protein
MATAVSRPGRSRTRSRASRPRTAFVLSGGASLGALQVGMLQALDEQDVVPDVLVGTSVAALNAAFIASRAQTTATATALARVWHGLAREDIFPISVSALVGGLCGRRDHFVPERGLRRVVRRYVEFDDLADAPIPLHLLTFDLASGREVLLSTGPAVASVLAAASIPGVFPPVAIRDRRLVDGGVINNTPISHAVGLGAERIYVLPTEDPSDRRVGPAAKSALDAAMLGVRLLVQSRLETDIARYSPDVELIVLPAPNPLLVQPTNFEHSVKLVRDGHLAARAVLTRREPAKQLRLAG